MKKKYLVLTVLFALPLLAYMFFASGVYNFNRLPVVQETPVRNLSSHQGLNEVAPTVDSLSFKNQVTVIGFLGDKLKDNVGYTANASMKVYKYFQEFGDFQMIYLINPGSRDQIEELKEELGVITNVDFLRFVETTPEKAKEVLASLGTDVLPAEDGSSLYAFVIDRDLKIRSRIVQKSEKIHKQKGNYYGYDITRVSEMGLLQDDIKALLAQYRLALKKNNNSSDQEIEFRN